MTDYSPFVAPRGPRSPQMALARTLWTMTKPPAKSIMAAIYVTDVGRELRVTFGDANGLVESMLSRTGDEPLEMRAATLKELLDANGWTSG